MGIDYMNGLQRSARVGKWILRSRLHWRNPLLMIHSVTARCNARCGFCAWSPDFYDGKDELSGEEVRDLYRQAWNAGLVALSLWGGEPLLRRDIGELAGYAKSLGFVINMVTNGALLSRRMDEVLPHLDKLCISIDHPSGHHDQLRGVPGLWDKLKEVIPQVRKRYPAMGLVISYTFLASNTEAGPIEAMARLKKQGLPILNSSSYIARMQRLPLVYRCHWPKFILPVEANGDIVDCMHWGQTPIDNIRKRSFKSILASSRMQELTGAVGESCHKCRSIHRFELSQMYEGRLGPLWSWGQRLLLDRWGLSSVLPVAKTGFPVPRFSRTLD